MSLGGRSHTVTFTAAALPMFSTTIVARAVAPALTVAASHRFVKSSVVVVFGFGVGLGGGGGGEPIATDTLALLLDTFGSAVGALTTTLFVAEPPAPAVTRTRTTKLALAPEGSAATMHVTTWPAIEHPAVEST